jgi:ribosomal-protein-alanine N-acetyltransferase
MELADKGVHVRFMEPEDVKNIAALEITCFSAPWSETALAESLGKQEYTFLVAELDGAPAGYVGMIRALDEGEITDVAVWPEHRRKGVAQALMEALLREAKEQGLCQIFLEVRESNQAAIALYEKTGFRPIGLRKNFYEKPREHAVLMSAVFLEK